MCERLSAQYFEQMRCHHAEHTVQTLVGTLLNSCLLNECDKLAISIKYYLYILSIQVNFYVIAMCVC